MINASQYAQAMQAASFAKKAGFDMEVTGNRFTLKPNNGVAAILLKDETAIQYDNLENAVAFLRGWEAAARHLASLAGIDVADVKSRVEQQKVADTLAGKRRKTLKI